MNTKKIKSQTVQKMISYRFGEKTSKVSIQPAIYEAMLSQHGNNESVTNGIIKDLAIEGIEYKVADVSLYVQSKLLLSLLPISIRKKINFSVSSHGRVPVRYKNPVTNVYTKLTTLSVLNDILNVVFDGKGNDIHINFAKQVHISKQANHQKDGEQRKCDVSHIVRERIVSNLILAVAA